MKNNQSAFILFKTEDEKISIDVCFEDDTVWLSQEQMALLFGKARTTPDFVTGTPKIFLQIMVQ